MNKNNNSPPDLEEKKIKFISNNFHLNGLYYDLDNHNIFKRVNRYKHRIILIIIFFILVAFNLFEIIFSIVILTVLKKKSDDFSYTNRFVGSMICLLNIFGILILSSITILKLKIKSSIFY